jgi:hypothetical protein
MFIIILILTFCLPVFSQPDAVSTLEAISGLENGLSEGSIKLNWIYPGPDSLPQGSTYYIPYSTFTGISWSISNAQVSISTGDVNPSQQQVYVITGLDNYLKNNNLSKETTFYFAIWISSGSEGLISDISNIATGWITLIPPSKITDISLSVGFKHITLSWSFPFDDDNIENYQQYSASYEIRYSSVEIIDEGLWNSATECFKLTNVLVQPGVSTTTFITGLENYTTYYFAIKFYDDLFNFSRTSTTSIYPFNSPPNCLYPLKHFSYDPIRATTSTIITSTTVKLDWTDAGWNPGSDDDKYGDKISSYTVKISTYLINGLLGKPTYVFESITLSSVVVHNLNEDTTYYWQLFSYDTLSFSSASGVFYFVINSSNSQPVFQGSLISPTTVWHTNNWTITFSWNSAKDNDPYDYVVGYRLFASSDETNWYQIPESGYIKTNSTNVKTTEVYCKDVFDNAENKKIYWYVVAYDSGVYLPQSHIQTSTTYFWLNQKNEAPKEFSVSSPTAPSLITKLYNNTTYYIIKSTPINLSWQATSDPDPQDCVYEYGIFVSSSETPDLVDPRDFALGAWRLARNSISAPIENQSDWFKVWDFFVSTSITKYEDFEEGVDINLYIKENWFYWWCVRAYNDSYLIWEATYTFSNISNFVIDFTSEPPTNYDVIEPTGTINPPAPGEGNIKFRWEEATDPDPFDSVKYYYIYISTFLPYNLDDWFYKPSLGNFTTTYHEPPVSFLADINDHHKFTPGTTYYWQVITFGENEWSGTVNPSTSNPSNVKPYGIAKTTGVFVISNNPPNPFNLLSPGTTYYPDEVAPSTKTFTPTLSWDLATDPDNYDGIISSYIVVISSDYYIVLESTRGFFSSTTYFTIPTSQKLISSRTTYYWKVIAVDKYAGNLTPSTTIFFFYTQNFEPNKFELITPTNDVVVLTLTPTFKWQNNGDPDNDPVHYTLYYSSYSNLYEQFTSSEPVGINISSITSPWTFDENKQYFWYVEARDDYGGLTRSTTHSFWINATEEPPNDFMVSIISGVIKTPTITFSWNPTSDPDPKDYVSKYIIKISTIGNTVIGISTYVVISDSNTTSYDFSLSSLKENAAYCWWIEAYDKEGNIENIDYKKSSSSYVFIVDLSTEMPDSVTLDIGLNIEDKKIEENFVYISTYVKTKRPTLKWTAGNKTEWWKTVDYDVYFATAGYLAEETTSFTSPIYSDYKIATSTYVYYKVPYELQENTSYYFYLIISNSSGTICSSTFYFFVDERNDSPVGLKLSSPTLGETLTTRKPTFYWELATDPDDKVAGYTLILSSYSDFSVKFSTTLSASTSFYTPTFRLQQDTTLYWKVECFDTRGEVTSTDTWHFFIPLFKSSPVADVKISTSPAPYITPRKPLISFSTSGVCHPEPNTSIIGYRVLILDDKKQTFEDSGIISTNTYSVKTNLPQNLTYYIRITVVDDEYIESEPQIIEYFVPLIQIPERIKNLSFDIEGNYIVLNWQEVKLYRDGSPADDLKGYNIYRAEKVEDLEKSDVYKCIPSSITTFRDFLYTTYYYLIKTTTLGGIESEPSDIVSSYNLGSYILSEPKENPQLNIILPKELKELKDQIFITPQQPETYEQIQLNVLSKYELQIKDKVGGYLIQNYKFSKPVEIEVYIPKETFELQLKPMLFYHNNIEYILLNTNYDKNRNTIKSTIFKPGLYAVRLVSLSQNPEVVSVYPKKIFTPTAADERYNKIHFVIYNPTTFQPEGEIYDLEMRFVSKMKYENGELTWDGRYDTGEVVPKGVYIYRIKIKNKIYTGSIIVAK